MPKDCASRMDRSMIPGTTGYSSVFSVWNLDSKMKPHGAQSNSDIATILYTHTHTHTDGKTITNTLTPC